MCEASDGRFAGVADFGGEKLVETAFDLRGHGVQQVAALRQRQLAQGPCSAARAALTAWSTSISPAAATMPTRLPIDGRTLFELLVAFRWHELIVDEVQKRRAGHGSRTLRGGQGGSNEKSIYTKYTAAIWPAQHPLTALRRGPGWKPTAVGMLLAKRGR